MPTYDYECPSCGTFELFQSITANPIRKCPTCKSKVKRLIATGGGLLFKGSGFYITDYRSEDYKKQAKAETKAADGKGKKDSDKKSKPDDASKKPKPSSKSTEKKPKKD